MDDKQFVEHDDPAPCWDDMEEINEEEEESNATD